MSRIPPSSSSWLVPFALGASTALSLVWISRHYLDDKKEQTTTTTTTKTPSRSIASPPTSTSRATTTKSNPPPSNLNNVELMDSTDLDHRLLRKAEAVLQWRTTRLVVVVERCTNDHNYSAILRTVEALGIQKVYMIDPPEIVLDPDDHEIALPNPETLSKDQIRKLNVATPEELQARRQHHLFARKATEWLTVHDFATSQECVAQLRAEGYQLWVTDLSQEASCLTMESPKIPDKVALVMGTEAVGCSQYLLDEADLRVYLPLRGFADSLNLSVATALIVHQLLVMDPTLIGAMSEEEKLQLRQAWYGKLCQQRLLTSSQRKERRKLQALIQKCQVIYERTQQPNARKLFASEQEKLNQWQHYKQQLADLESCLDPAKVQAAVQEWVQNPPAPLTDVRRADEHRICYVGKNTKALHEDDWKDMVATSKTTTVHLSTAATFRDKVKHLQ